MSAQAPTTPTPTDHPAGDRAAGDQAASTRTGGARTLAPAKAPVGTGAVQVVGTLLALALTALGVAAVRDALVAGEVVPGRPWLLGAASRLDGLEPAPWALALGLLLLVLGLWLVLTALARRPRRGLRLRAATGVYIAPRDVDRLAAAVAEDVDGVLHASSRTSRRTTSVTVRTTGDPATEGAVREVVSERLTALDPAPSVRVDARSEDSR